jgi:PAS domain S-box-containing protein
VSARSLAGVRGVMTATRALGASSMNRAERIRAVAEAVGAAVSATCELELSPVLIPIRPDERTPRRLVLGLQLDGAGLGKLALARAPDQPAFDDDDVVLAELLADHVAFASAHRALREGKARYRRLFDAGTLGVLVTRLDGTVVEANQALADLIGYPRGEIVDPDFDWARVTPPGWEELDARAIAQLRAAGVAAPREKQYVHRDGHRIWVLVGSARINETDDVISFVLDITAAVDAETGRRELAAIVASSGDAIIGLTLDGIITSWNRGAVQLFGYAADEMVGSPIARLLPPGREDEEAVSLVRLRAGEVRQFETVRRHKDGRDIDVWVTSSPTYDATGGMVGGSKVVRDITARRRAEAAVVRAREHAERTSRELEAFSYSVAHDLRAPLRAINGFARLLVEDHAGQLDAQGRDYVDEVRAGVHRMAALIDALLALSRLTRKDLRRESVDLATLARACVAELAVADPERRVDAVIPASVEAYVDQRLARVVIDNLVGNAWKFTSKVAAARIELGVATGDGTPTYYVRDNGAGFDPSYARNLFSPFQRMHAAEDFPGTGIGLATVQRIIHHHGGRIWADAAPGAGATFYFTLPGPLEDDLEAPADDRSAPPAAG